MQNNAEWKKSDRNRGLHRMLACGKSKHPENPAYLLFGVFHAVKQMAFAAAVRASEPCDTRAAKSGCKPAFKPLFSFRTKRLYEHRLFHQIVNVPLGFPVPLAEKPDMT